MKISRFFTLLFTICLLTNMFSCSDDSDENDSDSGEKLVLIKGMNATITDILITSGEEVLINQSELNTDTRLYGFENYKKIHVKVTAKAFYNTLGDDEGKVSLLIAKSNGKNVDIIEQIEKEDALKGEEITLSATISF